MNTSDHSASERNDLPTPQIRSTTRPPGDKRTPIKHILIGTPQIVQFTTRRLEQAGYAQAIEWAMPLELDAPLNIVPDPGDVISLLVRYLALE
ncbi:hypothetical protein H6F67_05390 [Microcoleus sp. FACHB-1515]|uniref:hypothetical protein n=1 Tax=Cyanophyceae TaxID=3028117 RepID=UPI0016898037|nr:hypothetical protein [Microcoleus sp. FACHB-1515]MBD2089284.1 hypothetical protein [Microcoleus sp. FACHB-1515]